MEDSKQYTQGINEAVYFSVILTDVRAEIVRTTRRGYDIIG